MIVFVGFWITFEIADSFSSDKEQLVSYELKESKEYDFVFLKTPKKVDNIRMTFADLIVEGAETNNYEMLTELLNEEFEGSEVYWLVMISDSNGSLLKKLTRSRWASKGGQRESIQEIKIPGYKKGELKVSVRLTDGEILG